MPLQTGPLRVLEFGCGAGMNLIGLVSRLQRTRIPLDRAFGNRFLRLADRIGAKEGQRFSSQPRVATR